MSYYPDPQQDWETQKYPQSSGKLILPGITPTPDDQATQMYNSNQPVAYSNQSQGYAEAPGQPPFNTPFGYIPPTPPRRGLLGRLGDLWARDAAYKVLFASIAAVILAMVVFVGFAYSMFAPHTPPAQTTTPQNQGNQAVEAPAQQQQPTVVPTQMPTLVPTPTQVPTVAQTNQLVSQIVAIPTDVKNNARVKIQVATGVPGSKVTLQVRYNVAPFMAMGTPRTSDANGNVTLNWRPQTFPMNRNQIVTATVTVTAVDQNGNKAVSDPVEVNIHR